MARRLISTSQIVTEVKIILDENDDSMPLLNVGDVKQLKTDEIIEHLIPRAIDRVVAIANLDKVIDMAEDCKDLEWSEGGTKFVYSTLPDDVSRLVYVRLSSWKRGVSDFINDTDDKYLEYISNYAGIRPDVESPGVALRPGVGKTIVMECFPFGNTNDAIVKYIPDASESYYNANGEAFAPTPGNATPGDGYTKQWNITSGIEGAVIYMVANLYYITLGESDRAELMATQVKDILGTINNAEQ